MKTVLNAAVTAALAALVSQSAGAADTVVTSMEHDADGAVVVAGNLLDQVFELADVRNGARVDLGEERHLVGLVVGDGNVDDRPPRSSIECRNSTRSNSPGSKFLSVKT